jgi:glycosyltransferase involved in cell wall biosynthesis
LLPYKQPEVYVQLARAVPEARFRMVAVPRARPPRGDPAPELPSGDAQPQNLEILPPLPRAALMALLERAVAVVNTSDHEGMPNTFLEAWARGVPALSFAVDPDGLIVGRGLGEFARGSRDALVAAARRLWETRLDQHEVAERCRTYVSERHSPDAIAARWQEELGLRRAGEPVASRA